MNFWHLIFPSPAFPHPPLSFLMVHPGHVIHHLYVLALYRVGVFLCSFNNRPYKFGLEEIRPRGIRDQKNPTLIKEEIIEQTWRWRAFGGTALEWNQGFPQVAR